MNLERAAYAAHTHRRKLRLLRTVLAAALLWQLLGLSWNWWAGLDPWERSSAGLFTTAAVMLVWGIAACLREHRQAQARGVR